MRCKICQYELDSLDVVEAMTDDAHRCPECGHPLDPADPDASDTRLPRDRTTGFFLGVALTIAAFIIFFFVIIYRMMASIA